MDILVNRETADQKLRLEGYIKNNARRIIQSPGVYAEAIIHFLAEKPSKDITSIDVPTDMVVGACAGQYIRVPIETYLEIKKVVEGIG